MKLMVKNAHVDAFGRSPCGERGLKWARNRVCYIPIRSLPVRGAWIEISPARAMKALTCVAPRAGSVD